MSIAAAALSYATNPFPAFQPGMTSQLVQTGWDALARRGLLNPAAYSVAACLGKESSVAPGPVLALLMGADVQIELPDLQQLGAFYEDHGLADALLPAAELPAALPRLAAAFAVLARVPAVGTCVGQLVRSLLVLRQPEAEIDLSYSHPAVPFSVFVSVCADDTPLSSLRVAESLLHEAMHLQLSLLESVLPLVQPDSSATFYSPWRNEPRPVRGVLHGLYVFCLIYAFYQQLRAQVLADEEQEFIQERLATIRTEVRELMSFPAALGLTGEGRQLATNLLDIEAA